MRLFLDFRLTLQHFESSKALISFIAIPIVLEADPDSVILPDWRIIRTFSHHKEWYQR